MSSRAASPFVVFSARGIPATLQTQELFGQRPGVMGGALAEAGDGTLVIADAEHLTDSLRGVLVQIVKEGRVSIAGESEPLRPSLIVTADCREGAVLGDVEVHTITLAGLADRQEDILPLGRAFPCGVSRSKKASRQSASPGTLAAGYSKRLGLEKCANCVNVYATPCGSREMARYRLRR